MRGEQRGKRGEIKRIKQAYKENNEAGKMRGTSRAQYIRKGEERGDNSKEEENRVKGEDMHLYFNVAKQTSLHI